ncbi:TM223 protein, partial [Serilophus lunatus]|nr:TM223 protein [Serilophus lunatus]
VSRDVLLFHHDRSRFFRLAGLFCAGQGLFWAYLAHYAFTALRPPPETDAGGDPGPEQPLRPRDNKWRGVGGGSLIVAAGCLFPLRSLRSVTLLRGGTRVTLSTHGPLGLGRGRSLTVPLAHVSGRAHRREAAAAVPIKVKGHPFYFLLDKKGQLSDPRLFDLTVGAQR